MKKEPGPDGITKDMIFHLWVSAKKAILALFLTNPGSQAPFQLCDKRPYQSLFTRKGSPRILKTLKKKKIIYSILYLIK